MLKIKNKFIIFIIILFLWVILFFIFNSIFNKKINTNSYVVLVKWIATLNNKLLKIDNKQQIEVWDTIRTIWKSALAILEWWDGSITRLWWDSSIKIDELHISNDLSKINIWFELLSWKSWSNVISFLWENSYFKEYFRDSEAAARWTIFNVDLNNDYLYVVDHKVTLTSSWKLIIIDENKPFNIRTFNFIILEKFIKEFKDNVWESINTKIDKEYFISLKEQLNNEIIELNKFKEINIEPILKDQKAREKLYNQLLTNYQKLNFVKSEDSELFKTKLELKNTLIKLADEKDKNILVKNTLYDFKDALNKWEYTNLNTIITMLYNNKNIIWEIDFKEYFKWNIIPEKLKEFLKNNLEWLKNIFWKSYIDWVDIGVNFKDIKDKWDSIIQDTLDNWLDKIDNLINK